MHFFYHYIHDFGQIFVYKLYTHKIELPGYSLNSCELMTAWSRGSLNTPFFSSFPSQQCFWQYFLECVCTQGVHGSVPKIWCKSLNQRRLHSSVHPFLQPVTRRSELIPLSLISCSIVPCISVKDSVNAFDFFTAHDMIKQVSGNMHWNTSMFKSYSGHKNKDRQIVCLCIQTFKYIKKNTSMKIE